MINGDNAVRAKHLETLVLNLKFFTLAELSVLTNALKAEVSQLSIAKFTQSDLNYIFNDNAFSPDDLIYIFTDGETNSDIDWAYVFTDGEHGNPFSTDDINYIFSFES